MSQLIISVSGLRGIVGQTFTPDVAVRYAAAFCAELPDGPILVARDGRPSGRMLASAIEAALTAMGRHVLYGDVMATPTVGVVVRAVQAAGAIQISASHNPPPYNGIKLFGREGRVLPADAGSRVAERYRAAQPLSWAPHDALGTCEPLADSTAQHLQAVLATVDVPRIRAKAFHVVLDANHGAGSVLGRKLLEQLGCRITLLGGEPHGAFAHPPEPTAENLADVGHHITRVGAHVGFCQDPDADRLAIIDEEGHYVGEEYTLALCVEHRLRRQTGPVVVNCATSRMTQDICERRGVPLIRSAVGEANVVDAMLRHNAVFGGEGNGGPIDPRVGLVRDSFVGIAQVLDAMAARERSVSALVNELPRYAIIKRTIPLDAARLPRALDALESHFSDASPDRLDGLRLDWDDRWLLIRGSNTEPIVRIIAESATRSDAAALCDEAERVIRSM